jgi:hypothetical protein
MGRSRSAWFASGCAFAGTFALTQAACADTPSLPVMPVETLLLPGPSALSISGPGPNLVLSSFNADTGMQTDVIFGRNGANSYPLSWRNVQLHSELVVCDGHALRRDLDYTFDNVSGAIQFARPLRAGVMARITYNVDTPDAGRNTPAVAAPLYWGLWQDGANVLRLRTLAVDTTNNSAAVSSGSSVSSSSAPFGRDALQWMGSTRLLRGQGVNAQMETRLFMDLQGGDWLDRGGMGLNERTHWGRTDWGFSYARAGTQFTQAEESGLAAGQENLEARASATPANGVTVTGSVKQTTQLPADPTTPSASTQAASPAVTTTEANASVALELAALRKTKLTASLSDRYTKDGVYRNGEALVELPRLPFGQTQISGGVQISREPGVERATGLLSASARPYRYLEVAGDARLRDGALADDRPDPTLLNTYGIRLNYAPSKRLKLTGGVTRNPEQGGSVQRAQRNSFGLESDWGLFALHGQVGLDEDLLTTHFTDSSEFGLDLRLTRFDTFTTGFKGINFFDHTAAGTNTYLLGFTHRLGSLFDVSLNGSLVHSTNTADSAKPEIKTEAKLGLHF